MRNLLLQSGIDANGYIDVFRQFAKEFCAEPFDVSTFLTKNDTESVCEYANYIVDKKLIDLYH